ncbi:MAG TPA: ABC transporter permease [Chloroflexota bacterium]|nr:ABC transporter permease [Chloroflexota bacterium]
MGRYVIRRLLQAIPLLFVISVVGFTLYKLAPNSPFRAELALVPGISESDIRALEAKYGLDQPLHVQYRTWAWNALHGDFGRSFFTKRPVMEMITERLPNTLTLAAAAFVISLLVGVPLGIVCAVYRNTPVDNAIRAVTVFLTSFPSWWIGLICLIVLGGQLRLVPLGGVYTIGKEGDLLDRLHHLILPACVAGIDGCVGYLRIMRSQTLEVMRQDYVRTAYAKGLRQSAVMWGHVLRNAFLPVWTGFGGLLAALIGGAAFFEFIFSWPGVGRLILDSALKRDFPVILANLMIGSALLIVGYIVVDVGYAWIDPRVRVAD